MQRILTASDVRAASRAARARGARVGFVPTMGALHQGHLALVRAAREEAEHVCVSIFVNPAQFAPGGDLERYPRDLASDEAKLRDLGVDVVYAPDAEAVYPPGYASWVNVEGLTEHLDGASRPGYFRGICTVVSKLFHAVEPDAAYFGQKDIQQAVTIRRMARDLEFATEVRILPTVRAADGLALSSRNAYLDADERAIAPRLFAALELARARFAQGERAAPTLRDAALTALAETPAFAVDYVNVVSLATMQPIERVDAPACLAAACDLNGTRLIDNVLLVDDADAFLRNG